MSDDAVGAEIHDLNLTYLLLAQRLLREDYETALVRLKIEDAMAQLLLSLSIKQLNQLSRTNQFVFRLCFEDAEKLGSLVNNQKEHGLSETHAALLLASAGSGVREDANG